MSVTVQTIIDEVDELVAGDSELDIKILQWIKSSLRRLPRHARLEALLAEHEATVSANARTLALPATFVKENMAYYLNSSSNKIEIDIKSGSDFNNDYSPNTGTPVSCRIIGRNLELNCLVASDTTVGIEHFQSIDDITALSSLNISTDIMELIKDGTFAKAYGYLEDDKREHRYWGLFDKGIEQLDGDFLADNMTGYVEEVDGGA